MSVKKSALLADLNQFYEQYYAETLRKAGFVSQGDGTGGRFPVPS